MLIFFSRIGWYMARLLVLCAPYIGNSRRSKAYDTPNPTCSGWFFTLFLDACLLRLVSAIFGGVLAAERCRYHTVNVWRMFPITSTGAKRPSYTMFWQLLPTGVTS